MLTVNADSQRDSLNYYAAKRSHEGHIQGTGRMPILSPMSVLASPALVEPPAQLQEDIQGVSN